MKIALVFILSLMWASVAFAQDPSDFGNNGDRPTRYMYPTVEHVRSIGINDGIRPIEFDQSVQDILAWIEKNTAEYPSNQVRKFAQTGTRIVKIDSVSGEGKMVFVISSDDSLYICLYVGTKRGYRLFFNRKLAPADGRAYSGRDDQPILGVIENADHRSLYDLLYQMLPHKIAKPSNHL
jgi:hypothetical protein